MSKYFAGIGSRDVSEQEKLIIKEVSEYLSSLGYTCFSGNADGSDINFQKYCNHISLLPWNSFNFDKFVPKSYVVITGRDAEALESVDKFHPYPHNLKFAGRKLMARNYRQIIFNDTTKAEFVVCCCDVDSKGNEQGGTGQACRIARHFNIPVYNIRNPDFKISVIDVGNKI